MTPIAIAKLAAIGWLAGLLLALTIRAKRGGLLVPCACCDEYIEPKHAAVIRKYPNHRYNLYQCPTCFERHGLQI
jgi:hypothetical protein